MFQLTLSLPVGVVFLCKGRDIYTLSYSGSCWDLLYYSKGTPGIFKCNPISYQIVVIMSSVALVHMLNLCSVYRGYVCLPSFVLVVDGKSEGHEEQFLVMTSGTAYPLSAASCANFLTCKVSDFRHGILSMLHIPGCTLFNFLPQKSD